MKNTLSIASNCVCTCVDSIADGTNRIFVALNIGIVTSPVLKIWKNDVLQTTIDLTAGDLNNVEISSGLFEANAVIKFQYLDDGYTGNVFTINFPSDLTGSLKISTVSDYVYSAKYTKSGGGGEGTTVTVKVNSTTTGAPGSSANVTNSGDDVNVKLDFVIPRGEQGPKGDNGEKGEPGPKGDPGDVSTTQLQEAKEEVLQLSKDYADYITGYDSSKGKLQPQIDNKSNVGHTHNKSEVGLGNVDNTADSQKSVNYANSSNYANSAGSASNAGTTTISGNWKKVVYGNGHGYITGFQLFTNQSITTAYGNVYFTSVTVTIPASCRASGKSLKNATAGIYASGSLLIAQISNVDLASGAINLYITHPVSKTGLAFNVQISLEF